MQNQFALKWMELEVRVKTTAAASIWSGPKPENGSSLLWKSQTLKRVFLKWAENIW